MFHNGLIKAYNEDEHSYKYYNSSTIIWANHNTIDDNFIPF